MLGTFGAQALGFRIVWFLILVSWTFYGFRAQRIGLGGKGIVFLVLPPPVLTCSLASNANRLRKNPVTPKEPLRHVLLQARVWGSALEF